jgi:signal transduction histidine kinase
MPASLFNHHRYDRATQQALLSLGIASLKPWLSVVLAVLLVVFCTGPEQRQLATIWLSWAVLSCGLGLWYCQHWRERLTEELSQATLRRAELWGIGYGSISVAILWGSSSLFMHPDRISTFMHPDQISNLMIAMIYFGVCAGAAAMSVLGMAHMGTGALVACLTFTHRLPVLFPDNWIGFTLMVVLYHFVILMSSWQRHQTVVQNLILTQEQERLLHYQRSETARANKANQDKSSFLAAASHDLRQPVHAIMLLGHALHMKTQDEEARVLVEQMLAAGKVLSDQFNDLMELSRLESGVYKLSISPLFPGEFLRRKLQAHQEIATSKNITLRLALGWRLPYYRVATDISLLNRILDNLLGNAIKFSPPGASILLSAQLHQGRLRLAIHDQGQGIPPEEQANIFLPYVQLDNPTRERSRGIGLGLSIVKEAASLLQAELTLRSRPGHGSCFMLTLPAGTLTQKTSAMSVTPAFSHTFDTPEAFWLRGKKLLIVEDDLMVATALRIWAESWGMQVQHHVDPTSVPPMLAADLVICDIRLPGEHDGIYWLSQWLADWPNAGGVLVSGEAGESVQERAEQEGLLLLAKPVDPDILLRTLISLKR